MSLESFRKRWDEASPTSRVLAGILAAVLLVAVEHRLFVKRKLDTYRKLRRELAADNLSATEKNGTLDALRKVNEAARSDLAELRRRSAGACLGRAAVLAAVDALAERCGLVIARREEKEGAAVSARGAGRGGRGARSKEAAGPKSVVYSYALEGRFVAVYRFFLMARAAGAPFRISEVRLERKRTKDGGGGELTAFFDVEIPVFEDET
jgi:hypothetical protein